MSCACWNIVVRTSNRNRSRLPVSSSSTSHHAIYHCPLISGVCGVLCIQWIIHTHIVSAHILSTRMFALLLLSGCRLGKFLLLSVEHRLRRYVLLLLLLMLIRQYMRWHMHMQGRCSDIEAVRWW